MEKFKKVAMVTGGGQGIGEAICKRLSADGFAIAVADMNFENATKVACEIEQSGGKAVAIQVDVTSREKVFAAVEKASEELGGFDVMVNNAGVALRGSLEEITQEQYDITYRVNVEGVLWGMQAAAGKMKQLGHGGRIINATSQAGLKSSPEMAIYGSSKFAVRGLTQAIGRELIKDKINVNCYAPGIVETPMMKAVAHKRAMDAGQSDEWGLAQFTAGVDQGRLTQPEEIANAISFLAGPDCEIMVGQTLVIDGGMVFN